MARITIISIVSALLVLPIALCRPLELPGGLVPEQSSQLPSSPSNYWADHDAAVPTPTFTNTPSGTWSLPLHPTPIFATQHPTGHSTSSPTGWLPTATGIQPTGITPATGTASPLPSATLLSKREANELAIKKRRAFEGPRHHHFPHTWPHSSAAPPAQHSPTAATGAPWSAVPASASPSGSGPASASALGPSSASGTGWSGRPTGLMPKGTAPAITWPWASGSLPTHTTSVLTLPIESGIGGMV